MSFLPYRVTNHHTGERKERREKGPSLNDVRKIPLATVTLTQPVCLWANPYPSVWTSFVDGSEGELSLESD